MAKINSQKTVGLFWDANLMSSLFSSHGVSAEEELENNSFDLISFGDVLLEIGKSLQPNHSLDYSEIFINQTEEASVSQLKEMGFNITPDSKLLTQQILFWLWDNSRAVKPAVPFVLLVLQAPESNGLLEKLKSRGVNIVLVTHFSTPEEKEEYSVHCRATIDLDLVFETSKNWKDQKTLHDVISSEIAKLKAEEAESQVKPATQTPVPPLALPTGVAATWSEHLQQQQKQGMKPGPPLPSFAPPKNEPTPNYYDHSLKPTMPPMNRPPQGQFNSGYNQPHEIPTPSTIDIAASGGFWSTLQKQPMQRWGEEPVANPVSTETLTKEQRTLHDDLVTAIYAYNVNAAVSTLRKMYTKQTRTFRIPTVLGILLPDTAAMIVDGRTDLLNVAVCFALDSIQWCFGVQKGENIESFKYKMNANIARWILHETVKKGIPTTPTPVIQEATISVVNHILENVVELEFAWEMLTTLNISHPIQRIVPHVLAWRGYPNPSIEARVNDFLYDHPELASIIPPSNSNPSMGPGMHVPPPPHSYRPGISGPVSPTAAAGLPATGADRTSQMVQAFLRDQQSHHGNMDFPMTNHLPNQLPGPLPSDGSDDVDRKIMKLMGRNPPPADLGPRMTGLYREEYADPMRMRGLPDDKFRMKGVNPPPGPGGPGRGRYPGENPLSHMDYPMPDEYSMPPPGYGNAPRNDDMYGRQPSMSLHQSLGPSSRDYPARGFPPGKELHHFEQDFHDGIPLEGEDYLGSLARGPDDDRSFVFGQQIREECQDEMTGGGLLCEYTQEY